MVHADGSAVEIEGLGENSAGKDVKNNVSDANLYKSAGKSFTDAFGSFPETGHIAGHVIPIVFRLPEAFA